MTLSTNGGLRSWVPGACKPSMLPEGAELVAGFDAALVGYGSVMSSTITIYDAPTVRAIEARDGRTFPTIAADRCFPSYAISADPGPPNECAARATLENPNLDALVATYRRGDVVALVYDREAAVEALARGFAADHGTTLEAADAALGASDKYYDPDLDFRSDASEFISRGSEDSWTTAAQADVMLVVVCANCGMPFFACVCRT